MKMTRLVAALAAPFLLVGCLLQPGKFSSALTINADRSFSFAYKGEVIAVDPTDSMTKSLAGLSTATDKDDSAEAKAARAEAEKSKAEAATTMENKRRAVAEALSKEAGYRSVEYLGRGRYMIDYATSGTLTHNFLYPFNSDAEIIFPFVAIELRKDGTARMTAPAYAAAPKKSGMESLAGPGGPESNAALDGSFTLTTNAPIVMHNNEDGVKSAGATKTLTWRATPLTRTAPTAVVQLTPLR